MLGERALRSLAGGASLVWGDSRLDPRAVREGKRLTIGDLKAMAANQPSAGFVDQIHNAISYLEQGLQTWGLWRVRAKSAIGGRTRPSP